MADFRRLPDAVSRAYAHFESECALTNVDPVKHAVDLIRGAARSREFGLDFLARLVETDSSRAEDAVAAGVVGAVAEALVHQAGRDDGRFFKDAVALLQSLGDAGALRSQDYEDVMTVADAVATCMQALTPLEDTCAIVSDGCALLAAIFGAYPNTDRMHTAIKAVIATMRAHLGVPEVQICAGQALLSFCEDHATNTRHAMDAGALGVAFAALRAHPTEHDVQVIASAISGALLGHPSDVDYEAAVAALLAEADALQLLVAAARVLSRDAEKVGVPLVVLHQLTYEKDQISEQIVRAGALEVVTAIRLRSLSPDVCHAACTLIGNLTRTSEGARRAGELGAVEACVAVLRGAAQGQEELQVLRSVLHALNNLMVKNAPNTARVHRAAAAPVLRAVLDAPGAKHDVKRCADALLQMLQRGTSAADAAAAALLAEEEAEAQQAPSAAKRKSKKKRHGGGSADVGASGSSGTASATSAAAGADAATSPAAMSALPAHSPRADAVAADAERAQQRRDGGEDETYEPQAQPEPASAPLAAGADDVDDGAAAVGAEAAAAKSAAKRRSRGGQRARAKQRDAATQSSAGGGAPAESDKAAETAAAEAAAPVQQQAAAEAAAITESAAAAQQARAAPPPPPLAAPPEHSVAPAAAVAQEGRTSDALLAQLFPWMRLAEAAPPPPAPPPPAPPPTMRECCVCLGDALLSDLLLLMPCAHRCVCQACGDALLAAPTDARRCPKCRTPILHASRVFDD